MTTEAENLRLVHELEVHQLELEAQNQELRIQAKIAEAAVSDFQFLFEKMVYGAFYQSADGTLLQINQAGLEMFGLTLEEFQSRTPKHPDWKVVNEEGILLSPDQHPSMRALNTGQMVNTVVGVFNPVKKSMRWLSVNAQPQFKEFENTPWQVFVTLQDFTEIKQCERISVSRLHLVEFSLSHSLDDLLEESLNEVEKLTGSQISFLHFVDPSEQFLTLRHWSTRTKSEFCRAQPSGVQHPITASGVWHDCLTQRKPVIHNDFSAVPNRRGLPPGHAEILREMVVPIFSGKSIVAILGVGNKPTDYLVEDVEMVLKLANMAWDIAERIKAEENLAESEERFRKVVEITPNGIAIYQNGCFVFVNPAGLNLIRASDKSDLIGKPVLSIVHPDSQPEVIRRMGMVAQGMTIPPMEEKLVRLDGTVFDGEVFALQTSFQGKPAGQVIVRDVTERRRAMKELRESEIRFSELNATKDKFFSILAHDLKNPFNTILGFSEILKESAGVLDNNSIKEYARVINESAKNTHRLLENLLEWAKANQGRLHFSPAEILLKPIVLAEIQGLKSIADIKNSELVEKIPNDLRVITDENMLRSCLRNLITNAIKFTPKNGMIVVIARKEASQIVIGVEDNGIGMLPEAIEKLFRIETSGSTRGTENEYGTGLGLILCKEFVEKLGGRIWVESEVGKGSRFYFTLPEPVIGFVASRESGA